MNDILLRSLTGAIFIGLIIGGLIIGQFATAIVLGLFTVLGLAEYYRLFASKKIVAPNMMVGMAGGLTMFLLLLLILWGEVEPKFLVAFLPITFLAFLPELYAKSKTPITNISVTIFGWVYVLVPMFLIICLRSDVTENGWVLPLGMFIIIWSNDTFAYLTGRLLGKTKLFERISPNKTWEGTVGGIVFACLAGAVFGYFTSYSFAFWIPAAFIIAVGSIYGDLFESLIKRSLKIKDSGKILPGHGGILDRFDASLFTAPLFFTWCILWNVI